MVALKQLELNNKTVLGIQLLLPNISMYLIVYRYHLLCDRSMDLNYLLAQNPNLSVMQVERAYSFEDLMKQELVYVSPRLKRSDISAGMRAKDALEGLP